jgi:isopropylmalate/homocitrate/citramalate synthase
MKKNKREGLFITPYNQLEEVQSQFNLPKKVLIHDVTIREVMQSPRLCLRPEEKIRVAKALDKLGVYSIENGAYMTEKEKEVTTELVKMHKRGEIKAKIVPLAHWVEKDIDIALETGADCVLMSANGNPVTLELNDGVKPDEAVKRLTDIVKYAKNNGLYITAQIYDTYRTPLDFMERVFKSIVYEGGADSIAISDTFAMALPWTSAAMVRKIKSWVPNTRIEHHGHNDYGLSTAMMLGAVTGGAEVVHTSIMNLGERVGNAATEEVAMCLELLMGIDTGIDLSQIWPTCELVSELTKMPIHPNKAVIGENVFLQGSGMIAWHQFRWEKMGKPWYNMPFSPETIGKEKMEIILGVGCGRGIVEHELERMGITATREQMGQIADKVKEEAYIRKWSLPQVQFEEIIKEVMGPDALKKKKA